MQFLFLSLLYTFIYLFIFLFLIFKSNVQVACNYSKINICSFYFFHYYMHLYIFISTHCSLRLFLKRLPTDPP